MKKILFIIAMLFGVAYGQTIGYLRYDSVKMAKNGGTTELILENATKAVTGGVLTNTGNGRTAFVLGGGTIVSDSAWMLTGNAGTTAGTNFLGTTDNVGLMLKINNSGAGGMDLSHNTGFGVYANQGAFYSNAGAMDNTAFGYNALEANRSGSYNTALGDSSLRQLDGNNNIAVGFKSAYYLTTESNRLILNSLDRSDKQGDTISSIIYGAQDADAATQRLYLNSRVYVPYMASGVGTHSVRIDPTTGLLTYADTTSGGGSSTWNGITNPTGDQALTFDAGESSTWTDQNTTEDLFTVNSSTGTTNSMFSLNRTGTALAAGNNILELVSSGANGTNAITATGARISVTNTNATSGTNVGLAVTATGATTNNYSIQATGAMTLTAAAQTPASFESSFAGNMQVNWNSTTGNNVNFVFQDAGTARWYIGNNSATGSDRLHILNASAAEAVTVLQGLQVGINQTAPTARLHIGAGAATASYAPLKFTTGTNNTTAEAGAMEYTTPQLFFTNGRAVRQEIFQGQQARVSTQYDNTTTTLGNVTGLTANVAASGTYRFEAKLYTTSDVAGGIKVAIGGTATATAIRYEGLTTDAGLTTQGRAAALGTAVGAVTAVTAAYVVITGTITVNAAGTLTVQAAANAATGTTSVLTGSTFVITEML